MDSERPRLSLNYIQLLKTITNYLIKPLEIPQEIYASFKDSLVHHPIAIHSRLVSLIRTSKCKNNLRQRNVVARSSVATLPQLSEIKFQQDLNKNNTFHFSKLNVGSLLIFCAKKKKKQRMSIHNLHFIQCKSNKILLIQQLVMCSGLVHQ